MNSPLVSVIVPNYNHAAFLDQRISSIIGQTFQDFEVIILDDCSTDKSKEIIESYRQHPRISKIIYNEANSGSVFRQWKKGITEARGRYIWIAESDDWCEPSLLHHLTEGLLQHETCALAYCQSYATDSNNRILWQSQHPLLSDYIDGREYIRQYMVFRNSIFNASMVLWKKELFAAVQEDYLEYRFSGDWVFWISLCLQGEVFITGRLLNYFRNHSGDVSTRSYRSGLNFVEDTRILQKLYREALIPPALYKKAIKKKHRQYWKVRKQVDSDLLPAIHAGFYTHPSALISPAYLKWDARWHNFRNRTADK